MKNSEFRTQNSEAISQKSGVRGQVEMAIGYRLWAMGFTHCLLPLASCLLLLAGCQQGNTPPQPQQAPPAQVKKEPPQQEAAPASVEVKEEKKEAVVETRRRNPFKSFIVKATERAAVIVPKTPLQKYEVEQLKLVAIIWGINNPIAMVETPDGKGYKLKKGDLIGNRDGRVKRIEKDRVVVEEQSTEASGEVRVSEFEIKLPLPAGEEEFK